ncbi:MAG: ATP-dependent DNA helicase [Fibromonadaceae bacterium]|jgi:Rad3-related DNA helicase|nr:ATP-dependent DNA helicase [Fibromonadaceae bacterium]
MPDISQIYEKLNFTPRKGQLAYSKFVEETLKANSRSKQQIALAEGETGIGRTLGYLIPAMLHADETDERILITIASKAQLKQIQEKEIPAILPFLNGKIRPSILKERFSYICTRKFYNCVNSPELYLTAEERVTFFAVVTWMEKTKDGDLNEVLHYNRTPILWKKLACEAGSCLGEKCEYFSKCHLQKAKKISENSNLLLVQHRLFLQDMQMDFALLPHSEKIIFDDAHKLPQESQKTFGRTLYFYALRNAIKQNTWCKEWEKQAAESEKLFLALIKDIQNFFQKTKKRKIAYEQNLSSETGISPEPVQNSLKALSEIIEQMSSDFYAKNEMGKAKDCMQFASDIRKISSDITFFFAASHSEYVYWIDCPSNPHQLTFTAEPINPSAKWSKSLYPILKSAFFTSDTISINGSSDYLISRLALFGKNAKANIFSNKTPEEYPEVFAAEFLPKPTDEKFSEELTKTLCEIISKSNRNVIIFTDMFSVSKLQAEVKKDESLQSKTCFFQGTDGNFFNLAGFLSKEAGNILIGTPDELKSLEEMELPENCLIVISRLPFPDLKEPVTSKRMEILKEQDKNGFILVTMPETSLILRRAYSAILRSNKKQTLLLLDSRIISEQYGTKIQKLFPNLKTLSHRVFSTNFF